MNPPASRDPSIPKIFVRDLAEGMKVQSPFVITQKSLREYDRGKFLSLRVGDRSGKVNAVLWDKAEDAAKNLQEGDLVELSGQVTTYKHEKQITLKSICKIEDREGIDPADFLPVSPRPVEELIAEFDRVMEEIQDEDLRALIRAFREDESAWGRFILAPGGKMWHHSYLHGLLHHTLSVVKQCVLLAPFYPRVNVDMLLVGAIFHDAGKFEEFEYSYSIDYSTMGRLAGHVYLGAYLVDRLIAALPAFPEEKRRRLIHMILSHHGDQERSPILPMTIEAALLHHVENMDAQMTAFERELAKAEHEQQEWTSYVKLIDRFLYLGESGTESNNTHTQSDT